MFSLESVTEQVTLNTKSPGKPVYDVYKLEIFRARRARQEELSPHAPSTDNKESLLSNTTP